MVFKKRRLRHLEQSFEAFQQREADAPSQEQMEAMVRKFITTQKRSQYSMSTIEAAFGILARNGKNPFTNFYQLDDLVETADTYRKPEIDLRDPEIGRAYRARKQRELGLQALEAYANSFDVSADQPSTASEEHVALDGAGIEEYQRDILTEMPEATGSLPQNVIALTDYRRAI